MATETTASTINTATGDGVALALEPGLRPAAADWLRRHLGGAVHLPGEPGYEDRRQPLNPALDPHPALIVEAAATTDVQLAVISARQYGLPFAVQATGHGTHAAADGALLLKTSSMATVVVDPDRAVARVRPGARWGDVLAAAAPFGLAPLSGSSPGVGVVGFTLGGGVSWLSRKHGFAADSVLAAELVTADGTIVTTSAECRPDLFWALRGGGGNFGVVTALELQLHPLATVYAGTSYFPIERAAETLAVYGEWIGEAPDDLSTAVLLTRMPDDPSLPAPVRGRRVLAIRAMHAGGDADEAERLLAPLRAAAGPALLDGIEPVSFADAAMGGTAPRHLDLVGELPDPLIDVLVEAAESEQSPVSTVEVRHWGGAIADPGPNAGPVGHRDAPLSVIADAADPALAEALWPYATGGSFLNFLADARRTASAYTPADHARLAEIKASYDPSNFFRFGHDIAPARKH